MFLCVLTSPFSDGIRDGKTTIDRENGEKRVGKRHRQRMQTENEYSIEFRVVDFHRISLDILSVRDIVYINQNME